MYTLRIEMTDETGALINTRIIDIPDLELAESLMSLIQIPEEDVTDEPVTGRIVTPLPPGYQKEGRIEGLITPKSPLEIEREQNKRLSRLPKELKDEQE